MYFWIVALGRALRQPEARGAVLSAAALLAVGVAFYSLVEDWSVVDSLYFSVTTLLTIGFGDPAPTTDVGKLFTVLFAISGVGMFLAVINALGVAAVKSQARSFEQHRGREHTPVGGDSDHAGQALGAGAISPPPDPPAPD